VTSLPERHVDRDSLSYSRQPGKGKEPQMDLERGRGWPARECGHSL